VLSKTWISVLDEGKNKHFANSFSANVETESDICQGQDTSQNNGRKNQ